MYGLFTYIYHTNQANVGKYGHTWILWVLCWNFQRLLGCDHGTAVSLKFSGCAFRMVWTGSAGKEFTGPTQVVRWRIFGDQRNLFGKASKSSLYIEKPANQVFLHGLFWRPPHALLDFTINHHWTRVFCLEIHVTLKSLLNEPAFFIAGNPLVNLEPCRIHVGRSCDCSTLLCMSWTALSLSITGWWCICFHAGREK